jgi:hypothetical protein
MGRAPRGAAIGGGLPAGPRFCCGCACTARQHNAKTDKPMITLQAWLIFPHAIFIPGDQFIQISHDFVILWIDSSQCI